MLYRLRKVYEDFSLKEALKQCHKNAEIGEMFEIEFGAKIKNENPNKNNIEIGHHNTLSGLLCAGKKWKNKNWCLLCY